MHLRWQTLDQLGFVKLARLPLICMSWAVLTQLTATLPVSLADEPGVAVIVAAEASEGATGAVRIGINVGPIDAEVRGRLKLPEKIDGLVVRYVHPGGPAAKADLQVDDVIVHAGDKVIDSLESLLAVVQARQDKDLEVQVWRGGDLKTLKMRPTVWVNPGWTFHFGQPGEWQQMLPPNWRPGPGADLPWPMTGEGMKLGALPKDMSISITHKGDGPSQIVIHNGDKKYETSFDKLRELPADVQPHVRSFLMQLAVRGSLAMMPRPRVFNLPEPSATPDKKDAEKTPDKAKPAEKPKSPEKAVVKDEPKAESKPRVEPKSPVEPQPAPDKKPESKSKPQPKPEPKPDAKVEKKPEPKPVPPADKQPEPKPEAKANKQPQGEANVCASAAVESLEKAIKERLLPQAGRLAHQIERLSARVAELEKRLQHVCPPCPAQERPADTRTPKESRPAPRRRAKTADNK